jgi:Neuraminidase (sialidase)
MRASKDPANFDNWFPWIAVAKNGTVGIVYYDRRVSGNNTLTDAWLALSTDGGTTWKENRVSEKSSNFRTAFFGGTSFIGDYNGLAFTGNKALPFWTQGVGNDSDVYLDIVEPGGK